MANVCFVFSLSLFHLHPISSVSYCCSVGDRLPSYFFVMRNVGKTKRYRVSRKKKALNDGKGMSPIVCVYVVV